MITVILTILLVVSIISLIVFGVGAECAVAQKRIYVRGVIISAVCFVAFITGIAVNTYIQHKEFKNRLLDVVDSYTIYLNGEKTTKYETDVFSYSESEIRIVDESKEIIIFHQNRNEGE